MEKQEKRGFVKRIPSIVGIILCVILAPIMIMNLTIIAKSYINPDKVPDFFGIKPFVVLTGSMDPEIKGGDLIITKSVDPSQLKQDDIISFRDGNPVVTHRITEFTEKDGEPAFITKGDANNTEDGEPIAWSQVEGIYLFKIEGFGNLAMFMQTPLGLLVFVGIPLFGFILYDIIRRRFTDKREKAKEDEAQAEIARLKAQLAAQE